MTLLGKALALSLWGASLGCLLCPPPSNPLCGMNQMHCDLGTHPDMPHCHKGHTCVEANGPRMCPESCPCTDNQISCQTPNPDPLACPEPVMCLEKTTQGSFGQECQARCPVTCDANQVACPLTYDCDGCEEDQVCADDLSQCPVSAFTMEGCPNEQEPSYDPQYELLCVHTDLNVSPDFSVAGPFNVASFHDVSELQLLLRP